MFGALFSLTEPTNVIFLFVNFNAFSLIFFMVPNFYFYQNAFEYRVNGDSVTIFISKSPHKAMKTVNAKEAYNTRAKNGKTNHKPKPTFVNNQGQVITHEDIAGWQLSGDYNQGKRSSNNAGASFFGLSNSDEQKLESIFVKKGLPIIGKNIEYAIRDGIK